MDEQWFQEAFGRMAQGGARLLTSSNLGLSVPNWLNVGIPLLARITASKDFGGHSPVSSHTRSMQAQRGQSRDPRSSRSRCWPGYRTSCSTVPAWPSWETPPTTFSILYWMGRRGNPGCVGGVTSFWGS